MAWRRGGALFVVALVAALVVLAPVLAGRDFYAILGLERDADIRKLAWFSMYARLARS